MAKSVAVIIDGGFLDKELLTFRSTMPNGRVQLGHILAVTQKAVHTPEEELFRAYYYHCPPYAKTEPGPFNRAPVDFGRTSLAGYQKALQNDIRLAQQFAFRRGILRFRGWKCYARDVRANTQASSIRWEPEFQQKQVDMKIGLDVAWLASKRIVDLIAIVSGDTDFVPAMKFARREGVQVRLVTFEHRRCAVHDTLMEHSDYTCCIDLADLAANPL